MYNIINTILHSKKTRKSLFIALCGVLGFSFTAGGAFAQSATPTPVPDDKLEIGGFEVKSSIEFGARWRELSGNENKYKSDLNYRSGFRIFDSSISMEDKSGKNKVVDSILINSSGWGADPQGFTRASIEKLGAYRMDATVRRVVYFNNLSSYALNQHTQDTKQNFGDFDLKLFPQNENFRVNLGYSFNHFKGPGGWTIRISRGDEFPVKANFRNRSDNFRAGIETKLAGFKFSVSHGYRRFSDNTDYFTNAFQAGNNPADTAVLNALNRSTPIEGDSHYSIFDVNRTFAKRVDFTGRFIFSTTNSESSLFERLVGRDTQSGGTFIDSDVNTTVGDAKRIQKRGDLGLTVLVTDDFRISNTFSFDDFGIDGGEDLNQFLIRRNSAGVPLPNATVISKAYRLTDYSRYSNLIEGDYQFSNRASFHLGYRYSHRRVDLGGFNRTLTSAPSATNPLQISEEEENSTNAVIAGMKITPVKRRVIYWDVERGEADNVFTRLENYEYTNFRVRSRLTLNNITFHFSGISKDNTNPSRDFGAVIKSRIFSGGADWSPTANFSLSGGYTYTNQTSDTSVIVPVGSVRLLGFSQFFIRDNHAYVDVFAKPVKWMSFYGSYRISKDTGQGDRASTVTQNIINSYPLTYQSPEVRVAFRLSNNIDWNVGYQYYDYKDKFTPAQNYKAHLPYTSLRIYFGGADR